MDQSEQFYQRTIDRTPYWSFGYLVLILVAIFLIGFYLLWEAGSFIKAKQWYKNGIFNQKSNMPSINTDKLNADGITNTANDTINKIEDSASQKVNEAADKAQNTMTEKIKKTGQEETQQFIDSL